MGVDALFICGLAFDVCVAATARDAAKLGFLTAIITDCTKGLSQEGIQRTKEEMANLGVAMVSAQKARGEYNKTYLFISDNERSTWTISGPEASTMAVAWCISQPNIGIKKIQYL